MNNYFKTSGQRVCEKGKYIETCSVMLWSLLITCHCGQWGRCSSFTSLNFVFPFLSFRNWFLIGCQTVNYTVSLATIKPHQRSVCLTQSCNRHPSSLNQLSIKNKTNITFGQLNVFFKQCSNLTNTYSWNDLFQLFNSTWPAEVQLFSHFMSCERSYWDLFWVNNFSSQRAQKQPTTTFVCQCSCWLCICSLFSQLVGEKSKKP